LNPPVRGGHIRLTQLWEVLGPGIVVRDTFVKILAGKSHHLPPGSWTKLYLSYKLEQIHGGVTVVSSLSREGLVCGNIVTSGGLLHICVFNSTQRVVRITPSTPLLTILGFHKVEIQRLEPTGMVLEEEELAGEVTVASLLAEVRREFADVCNLSEHPVLPPMADLIVKAAEVTWTEPADFGQRTPYKTEDNVCRFQMEAQLEQYVHKGYLRRACLSERVFMSPLLPILKKDGSYRLTTDFRSLNAYFKREGQEQPDVWRKLWEVEPSWRWYAKIDLKDGFFGVPVEDRLQCLFAFSWGGRRYCWRRLPQGWTWSPVLFAERVSQIMDGIAGVVQFADDLLVGAETREKLRERVLEVFQQLQKFGLKVNLEKTTVLTDSVTFLGVELRDGTWSLHKYLSTTVLSFVLGIIALVHLTSFLNRLVGLPLAYSTVRRSDNPCVRVLPRSLSRNL